MKKLAISYDFSNTDFSRIAVIGCPGSGKTTFSKRLGEILSREVVHLDKILWKPNWEMPPYDERVKIHDGIIFRSEWIIDGMWKSHLSDRLSRATLVIFLDYKRRVSFSRALKRRLKFRGKQRDDIADGCLEKLDGYFVKYIWTFRRKARPQIVRMLENGGGFTWVALKDPKQTENFLRQLSEYSK